MSAPAAVLLDATRRQREAAAPRDSVWTDASAGTGKTKVLTDRVLRLLLDDVDPPNDPAKILCLTYTRAAAAEMANRINRTLAAWSTVEEAVLRDTLVALLDHEPDVDTLNKARKLFALALDAPGGLKIMTIHAFCESLIGRFPIEAGIAPHFELMDERSAAEALRTVREAVIVEARRDPNAPLAKCLAIVSAWANEEQFAEVLKQLARERGRFQRLLAEAGDVEALIGQQRAALGLGADETLEGILADGVRDEAFDLPRLRAACAALAKGSKGDADRGQIIADWILAKDRAGLFAAYQRAYLTKDGGLFKTLATKAIDPGIVEILKAEAERVLALTERCKALGVADASAALTRFGAALLARYEHHKRERAALDYEDLVQHARALLERDGGASWVLYKLDGGVDHILIDEAQDTSPDQWEIVRLLTAEFFAGMGARDGKRTIFVVGDKKQSIFSFQGADAEKFVRMRDHFAWEAKAKPVSLDISFRSTDAVLTAVDAVFAAREGVHHVPSREDHAGLVEVWPLVKPEAKDEPAPWTLPLEYREEAAPDARLAELVAEKIRKLCDEETLESRGRKIRPGDVMVLVARRTRFIDSLVRRLKSRNVPVAGIDRMVLTDQIAVEDLMALGRFLLLPEDDLTLAEVLKGPLFGIGDDGLFALAHGRTGTLWQSLAKRSEPAFKAVHDELAELLARADYIPPFELFADLLGPRGGRARIVARLGRDAGDPLDEFLALALQFQRSHAPSLQAFLHWLAAGATEIKRDLEHGVRDEVRILTVHGAKGLQAPVVFLPDTCNVPNKLDPIVWTDGGVPLWPPRVDAADPVSLAARDAAKRRRDEERRRLLYVAMTRAEDRLYVCGWQGRNAPPRDCWYETVFAAMPGIARPVTDLPIEGEGFRLETRQRVPATPDRDDAQRLPVAQRERPEWAEAAPRAEATPRPLTPSRPDGEEPPVRPPLQPATRDAFRRGILIHRLLQALPDLPPGDRETAARAFLAREEADAPDKIVAEVTRVLDDPRFAALFRPGARAEVALTGRIGSRLIAGQVDRLAVTDTEVLVIDYKSNRPPPGDAAGTPAMYLRQMSAYRAVLERIYPGKSIRCAILWTAAPALYELPARMLDPYAIDLAQPQT